MLTRTGDTPKVEILIVDNQNIAGCLKIKVSLWDPSFEISSYNKTHYFLEDDIAQLKDSNMSLLCGNADNLLNQVTTLVSLANMKAIRLEARR